MVLTSSPVNPVRYIMEISSSGVREQEADKFPLALLK